MKSDSIKNTVKNKICSTKYSIKKDKLFISNKIYHFKVSETVN